MKKQRVLAVLLTAVMSFSIGFFVACQKSKKVTGVTVDTATFKPEYELGERFGYSALRINVTYDDGTADKLAPPISAVTSVDMTVSGQKTVKVTHIDINNANKEWAANANFTVKDGGIPLKAGDKIVDYGLPLNIITHKDNIAPQGAGNEDIEFMIRDRGYSAGVDNPFIFFPRIFAEAQEDGSEYFLTQYDNDTEVFLINGTQETKLDAVNDYVETADPVKGAFQFKEAAIGKSFKIVQKAYEEEVDDGYKAAIRPIELTVKVIDGYNVYNAADFSRLDNSETIPEETGEQRDIWQSYKTQKGIPMVGADGENAVNAIILHNDIVLTKNDLAPDLLVQNANEGPGGPGNDFTGMLYDNQCLYGRYTPYGETFTLEGNYFTIDASEVPLVGFDGSIGNWDNEYMVSNAGFFAFGGDQAGGCEEKQGTNIIQNVFMIGNTPKTENPSTALDELGYDGGIKCFYTHSNMIADNVICHSFFEFALGVGESEYHEFTNLTINNSRIYDTFSSAVYLWAHDLNVNNTVIKNSGGPPLFMIEVDEIQSKIFIDDDSEAGTWCAGDEAWFVMTGTMMIAMGLKQLDAAFVHQSGGARSMVKIENGREYFFIISVAQFRDWTAPPPGRIVPGCRLEIGGGAVINTTDLSDPDSAVLAAVLGTAGAAGAPVFQTDGGGVAFFTTALTNPSNSPCLPTDPIFWGDYLNVFANGMCITIEYQ